ncbi:MAG: isoprenyl transferase [Henriciella sp.]|nr:isoprenyl transferase [Hyphomonadaceae bacterium]
MTAATSAARSGDKAPEISDFPNHVAIIMDGNGRWAKARGFPRAIGHERGVEALRRTVEAAQEIGLKNLTVFSFSTENWRRPVSEVNALFGLLKAYVKRDLNRLAEEGVKIRILGTRDGLPDDILELVDRAEKRTAENDAFNLCIAFNYGGREEMLRAAKAMAEKISAGEVEASEIDETAFARFLDTDGLPDPDILIRTSGEYRLSNFLIWQAAYAELVFLDVLWPDFGKSHLLDAIEMYRARERRFGGLASGAA